MGQYLVIMTCPPFLQNTVVAELALPVVQPMGAYYWGSSQDRISNASQQSDWEVVEKLARRSSLHDSTEGRVDNVDRPRRHIRQRRRGIH